MLTFEKILPKFFQCTPNRTRLFNFNKRAHTSRLETPRQGSWSIRDAAAAPCHNGAVCAAGSAAMPLASTSKVSRRPKKWPLRTESDFKFPESALKWLLTMHPIARGVRRLRLHTRLLDGTGFVYRPLHGDHRGSLWNHLFFSAPAAECATGIFCGTDSANNRSGHWKRHEVLPEEICELASTPRRKRPTDNLLCFCSPPGNTGLSFGGQMQLPHNCWLPGEPKNGTRLFCHRRARSDHPYHHEGNSKGLPLIVIKTGANHFHSAGFCSPAKLWPFCCCHASPNRASIICLYGLSVFSWDPDKRLSGAWMTALFPGSEEILGKCSQAPSWGGGGQRKKKKE